MSRSPGLFSSIQALILGSLFVSSEGVGVRWIGEERESGRDGPLVLLADVVALAQVHEVGDGLSRQERKLVDNVDLLTRR
jgi:hypothetical protein